MKKYFVLSIVTLPIFFVQLSFTNREPSTRAELGELLFSDKILSSDRSISCASCHKPQFAFSDTSATSPGVGGIKGTRNTPSSMNLRLQRTFFWDGRAQTLEEQALAPIENPSEMNLPIDKAILRLRKNRKYREYFKKIFDSEPTKENLAQALAAFERTLETSDSPFDNWKFLDEPSAVSDEVKRGFQIFSTKGKCTSCHFGADFTENEFRNIGLFDGKKLNDSGRYLISKMSEDIGRFKTPPLRNIAMTAPYMHNGMFRTLKEVIEFYNDPEKIVPGAINRDTLLAKPLLLTDRERADLEAFLNALTDSRFALKK
jgi:cytochrome c peroxidase